MPWIYRTALRIFFAALPMFIYIGFRLASAMAETSAGTRFALSIRNARLMVSGLIAWIYLWPLTLVFYYYSGNFRSLFAFQPQLQWQDYLMVFPAWWGLIAFVEILPYFILLDIYGWLHRLIVSSRYKKNRAVNTENTLPTAKSKTSSRRSAFIKIGIAVFFLLYSGVRTLWDSNHVRIARNTIAIPNLPEKLTGLQLTFFGDLHMDRFTQGKKLDILHETLHAENNDFIFFSGDLISSGHRFIDGAVKRLSKPRAKTAAIACMGDHDLWTAPERIVDGLVANGWNFLQDQHKLFTHNGQTVLVTGITYVYSQRIKSLELEQLLTAAPKADLKILLVHQPREHLVKIAAQYGYHLFLAGHTHGGEIVNHIFGFPVSPSKLETPYCWGIHDYKNIKVVITNGIGRTLAGLRYHAPAQINQLVLVKQ